MTRRQLSVISLPSEWEYKWITFITAENGGLGIAMLEGYDLYTLSRGTGMDGQAVWGNKRVVSFSKLLPAVAGLQRMHVAAVVDVLGVILIGTEIGLFSIDIKSSKVTKLWEGNVGRRIGDIVPYVTFCTPSCTRLVLP
jgi:ligand-binding sensor domain-containing protein